MQQAITRENQALVVGEADVKDGLSVSVVSPQALPKRGGKGRLFAVLPLADL